MQNPLLSKEKTTRENRIWVRIIAACNVKCIFCLDSDAQNGTLIDDIKVREEIQRGYKSGVYNRIIISGGEASIHPRFAEYIRYAKEVGYDRVQTVTNGNMFSRVEFCEKVFAAGLDEVTFSIHGHTAELHDYLTAAPGSYNRAIRGLINVRKYFPNKIVNIDIVVNKLNVDYLPQMIRFFMKLGVYEFDILQIIPFGRGFQKYKDQLFYRIEDHLESLHATWSFSRVPGVHMWTNRFPVEAFEGYEDLIQDPRKIKSEVMGEAIDDFTSFIESRGVKKPHCYGDACDVCFLKQYCHDYRDHHASALPEGKKYILSEDGWTPGAEHNYIVLRGEEFVSEVYKKYGESGDEFKKKLQNIPVSQHQRLINIPSCISSQGGISEYEWEGEFIDDPTLAGYTRRYITNFYRKKSTRCKSCKYNDTCQGIHINFVRSYGFSILEPILE